MAGIFHHGGSAPAVTDAAIDVAIDVREGRGACELLRVTRLTAFVSDNAAVGPEACIGPRSSHPPRFSVQ